MFSKAYLYNLFKHCAWYISFSENLSITDMDTIYKMHKLDLGVCIILSN